MNWSTFNDIVTSITEIIGITIAIGGPFLAGINWVANRKFVKYSDLEGLEEQMNKQDVILDGKINSLVLDVGLIRETIKHQPSNKDLEAVSSKIGDIAVEVARIGATCSGQSDLLRSIDQRLIEKNRS